MQFLRQTTIVRILRNYFHIVWNIFYLSVIIVFCHIRNLVTNK